MTIGILYGISVGSGDSELITVKGARILQETKVIAFPSGRANDLGIAQRIIGPWLSVDHQLLALEFPYVQDEFVLEQAWQKAANQVWNYLSNGEDVAFACEGDVNFYGTFSYLAQTVQNLYPQALIKAIPGVVSPLAAVSSLGIPLVQRDQKLLILPALYHIKQLEIAIKQADVIVLMKVSSVYSQAWQILQDHDLLKNSYIVEKASWPEEKIYQNLEQHPNLELSYFSLLIVKVNPV